MGFGEHCDRCVMLSFEYVCDNPECGNHRPAWHVGREVSGAFSWSRFYTELKEMGLKLPLCRCGGSRCAPNPRKTSMIALAHFFTPALTEQVWCNAPYWQTAKRCQLEKGHSGPHVNFWNIGHSSARPHTIWKELWLRTDQCSIGTSMKAAGLRGRVSPSTIDHYALNQYGITDRTPSRSCQGPYCKAQEPHGTGWFCERTAGHEGPHYYPSHALWERVDDGRKGV